MDALLMDARPAAVDHPPNGGGADDPYETIKVLEAWLTPEEFAGFLKGSAIKYLSRATREGMPTEDYTKAGWYAERLSRFSREHALEAPLPPFLKSRWRDGADDRSKSELPSAFMPPPGERRR